MPKSSVYNIPKPKTKKPNTKVPLEAVMEQEEEVANQKPQDLELFWLGIYHDLSLMFILGIINALLLGDPKQ
jgi:hypothetical protein